MYESGPCFCAENQAPFLDYAPLTCTGLCLSAMLEFLHMTTNENWPSDPLFLSLSPYYIHSAKCLTHLLWASSTFIVGSHTTNHVPLVGFRCTNISDCEYLLYLGVPHNWPYPAILRHL